VAAQLQSLRDELGRTESERDQAREMERKLGEQIIELRAAAELQQSAAEATGAQSEDLNQAQCRDLNEPDANAREQIVILQAEVDRLHTELDGLRAQASSEHGRDSVVDQRQDEFTAAPSEAHAVDCSPNKRPDVGVRRSLGGVAKFGAVAVSIAAVGLFAWLKGPGVLQPALDIADEVVSETIALVQQDAALTTEAYESENASTGSDVNGNPTDNPGALQNVDAVAATAQSASPEVEKGDERYQRKAHAAEVAAEPDQPVRTFRDRLAGGGKGPTMVELHAGTFRMGSGNTSQNFDERPRHEVSVGRFAISRYEVTFEQYGVFAKATGRTTPRGGSRGTLPVANVSWHDAQAYANWLSEQTGQKYRLPTEAEWEFAARSGAITRYWWGNQVGEARANCFDCKASWSGRETAPVGSFAASPFGVHDMAGNVREWVQDCYVADYKAAPTDGAAVEASNCAQRVIRGGSYARPSASMRVTSRDQDEMDTRLDDLGFRLARDF
jgi:formylglycine-generating enzyme required for sulfatase activity